MIKVIRIRINTRINKRKHFFFSFTKKLYNKILFFIIIKYFLSYIYHRNHFIIITQLRGTRIDLKIRLDLHFIKSNSSGSVTKKRRQQKR